MGPVRLIPVEEADLGLAIADASGHGLTAAADILVLYTDGVSEAVDASDAEFGVDRIRRLIVDNARRSSTEIVDHILKAVQDYSGITTPRRPDRRREATGAVARSPPDPEPSTPGSGVEHPAIHSSLPG